jgi:hypothetical protein
VLSLAPEMLDVLIGDVVMYRIPFGDSIISCASYRASAMQTNASIADAPNAPPFTTPYIFTGSITKNSYKLCRVWSHRMSDIRMSPPTSSFNFGIQRDETSRGGSVASLPWNKRHDVDRFGNVEIVIDDHVVAHRADRAATR